MAVNISEVRLLAVPLQADYKNTAAFGSLSEQTNYFIGKTKFVSTDMSYIKDNALVYPADYDDLQNVNYVMYKNTAFTSKYFYAFITDKERLNNGATKLVLKTDSMQTYLFDYECGYCFVEREHVTDDTIGAHTVPEGLETGEYICDGWTMNEGLSDTAIVVGATIDIENYTNQPGDWNLTKEYAPFYGNYYDGIYSGLAYYVIQNKEFLRGTLKNAAYEGQEDGIYTIFMAPKAFLNYNKSDTSGCAPVTSSTTPYSETWTCATKPTTLNGYEPKNKKLLTSPYCYLMVDNGGGHAVPYHYEKFSSDNIAFSINSTVTPGMSIRAIPKNYNGITLNDSEGLNLAKYATCSWNTDPYTSWLSKNGTNVAITSAAGLTSMGLGIAGVVTAPATGGASLAVAGAIAGGVGAVASQVASVAQHAQVPQQLHGNTNCGDVQTARGAITFSAYKMSIRKEYAEIIDRYFSMFGYKVNCFKFPNANHRKFFWYTKTVDAVIKGDIPQEDLQTIKNCYDKGVTFWRNPDNIGKYVDENSIVGIV